MLGCCSSRATVDPVSEEFPRPTTLANFYQWPLNVYTFIRINELGIAGFATHQLLFEFNE